MDSIRPNPVLQISLPLLFLFFSSPSLSFISLAQSKIASLGVSPKTFRNTLDGSLKRNLVSNSQMKMFYFDQNLDHFTYTSKSYTTFQQRYVIDFKYWAGAKANAPIFAFLGEESSLEVNLIFGGFLRDNGFHFKALLVYIEHRYYGESMPFGSAKNALENASTLGYLNSAQALADYAAILSHVKEKYSAKHSPIIVIGGSYGGMLAAWFRLKYPHIAIGALASSAPLLYFEDIAPKKGYYFIVTKAFKETSERCHHTIRESWDEIDRVAARSDGLSILSKKFKTCTPLNGSFGLKDYLDSIYAEAAQYNRPPTYSPVADVCHAVDGAPNGTDLLGRIFAGVVAYMGNRSCYDTYAYVRPTDEFLAWTWQTCSEMVMPVGHDKQDTMFQTVPFNKSNYIAECEALHGVPPRPHWITTHYGGQDFKLILQRFGSNIIFSNGLLDPYSVGGVLENISDSILVITTNNGSHCQDIASARKEDPDWLVIQREQEIKIIDTWISKYQEDLREFKYKSKFGY